MSPYVATERKAWKGGRFVTSYSSNGVNSKTKTIICSAGAKTRHWEMPMPSIEIYAKKLRILTSFSFQKLTVYMTQNTTNKILKC